MKKFRTLLHATAIAAAAIVFSTAAHAVCYVDAAATGAKDGSSWVNAYAGLQSALHDRTCSKEIWVRRGVYKPTTTTDQTISFAVALGVQLYGGFAGGETSRDARDPVSNPTILSGDIDNNDANAATTNIDTALADIQGDNSYHVITISGASTGMIDGPTIIDGFTITGGYAKYSGFHANGGGLNCDGHGNGSGTDAADCSPFLRHLIFSGNAAVGDGGAVYDNGLNWGSSSPQFEDVSFVGNSARNNGGALCNIADNRGGSSPSLTRVRFVANTAALGGAMYDRGEGAVAAMYSFSNPMLTDVTFESNSANTGGGMYDYALNGGQANPIFHSVTFDKNSVSSTSPSPYGGGLFVLAEGANSLAQPQVLNSTFAANQATFGGAVFYGTLSHGDVQAYLLSSTFNGNIASIGGALYDGGNDDREHVSVSNVIFWGDTATSDISTAEIKNDKMALGIQSSIIAGGCPTDGHSGCLNLVSGSPKLGPLQANGGFTQTMLPGPGGSGIDAGEDSLCPSPDQRGVTRPQGARCDIGSVEAIPAIPPTSESFTVTTTLDTPVDISLRGSDSNPGGPFALTFVLASRADNGSVVLSGDTVRYTPGGTFVGVDSFNYVVTDVNGTSSQAVVTIQVKADLPVAQPLSLTVPANTRGAVTLMASDDNPGGPFAFTFALTQLPQHGTATLSGATVNYVPDTGYTGADAFAYTVADSNGLSQPASVSIEVNAHLPVAQARFVSVAQNAPTAIALGATDSNAGGPYTFTFATASLPMHGSLSVVEGSQVTYTPAHDYYGSDTFTYTATDVNGKSGPATVTITVLAVGGGGTPGSVAALPALSFWNLVALAGLLVTFASLRGAFN